MLDVKELAKKAPEDLTNDDCKYIWSLCFHVLPDGEYFDYTNESKLLKKMIPETAQKYISWRVNYERELSDQIKNYISKPSKNAEPLQAEKDNIFLLLDSVITDKNGVITRKPKQTVNNWIVILENDTRFVGKIKYNLFSHEVWIYGSLPWERVNNLRPWKDSDTIHLFTIIQNEYKLNNRRDCEDSFRIVANRNSFHPIRDKLDSLKWDGKKHYSTLLQDYLGADDKAGYTSEVMRLFMLGAVARVYCPACKFDYVLILSGKQGIGKSTFLRILSISDDWFTDSISDIGTTDSKQMLSGKWILEIGELKALQSARGGIDEVKRFLTATEDYYRPPYGKIPESIPRQCVFAGTTNNESFLTDDTGNRRFLIVRVGENPPKKDIFNAEFVTEIEQAWSEIVHIWKTEKPKLVLSAKFADQASEEQKSAQIDDTIQATLESYLDELPANYVLCVKEIWLDVFKNNENVTPSKYFSTKVSNIMSQRKDFYKVGATQTEKYNRQRGWRKQGFSPIGDTENLPFM